MVESAEVNCYENRGLHLRPLIIIGKTYYFTQSMARVLSDEFLCFVHIFMNVESWKRSPYKRCAALIIIDVSNSLGILSCSEEVSQLRCLRDDAPIIVISDVDDAANIMENIRCGARGYIPTSMPLGAALEVIRLVLSGGVFRPNKGD